MRSLRSDCAEFEEEDERGNPRLARLPAGSERICGGEIISHLEYPLTRAEGRCGQRGAANSVARVDYFRPALFWPTGFDIRVSRAFVYAFDGLRWNRSVEMVNWSSRDGDTGFGDLWELWKH